VKRTASSRCGCSLTRHARRPPSADCFVHQAPNAPAAVSQKTDLLIHELIVVAFDMYSSSNILEALALTGDIHRYRNLLTTIKHWLRDQVRQ